MPNAIELQGVTKTFGPKVAVNSISLSVPQGSLYGFIGPNGAGKSTTIRMIMSILFPDSGVIRVLGKDSAMESKDRIGYLPEERGLYRKMKVQAFLEYMAKLKGVDAGPALATNVKDWLARVGLGEVAKKKCQELSKGMQQKVQFIASILHEPDLIILDEPFSGLDPINARVMRDLIHDLHQEGRTIIFSTHVMSHAEEICDHIIMINRGNKVLDASMQRIRTDHDPRAIYFEPATDAPVDAAALARLSGIASIQPVAGANGALPQGFDVSLANGAQASDTIARLAVTLPVRRIEQRRASLEDIFIEEVIAAGGMTPDGAAVLRASIREGGGAGKDAGGS